MNQAKEFLHEFLHNNFDDLLKEYLEWLYDNIDTSSAKENWNIDFAEDHLRYVLDFILLEKGNE
jgi:hypothetical protein